MHKCHSILWRALLLHSGVVDGTNQDGQERSFGSHWACAGGTTHLLVMLFVKCNTFM